MNASALVSGGKDSIYSAYLAESQGWTIDELVTLLPDDPESMMFHTPNLSLVGLQAEAWGKRHREVRVPGRGEVADGAALRTALSEAREWVVAGAIASSYQWGRLHRLCFELGRKVFAPLWGKDPSRVVRAEIDAGLDIRFSHLAAEPLGAELLGQRLDHARLADLERRSREVRAVHVAGEGGEFETVVLDAPFFRRRIEITEAEATTDGRAHRWTARAARLVEKPAGAVERNGFST